MKTVRTRRLVVKWFRVVHESLMCNRAEGLIYTRTGAVRGRTSAPREADEHDV